ncbi:Hypothetical protein PP7435_CHR1-1433 [Komagataella phaffii CBS 7435]|uniref:Uncharacterized protein n=2 Tax=Komagataella phaffii TaxID=460519 RepID=C4QZ08_KOMPG|nr:Hypothetical protein PAS_chr1-4_0622 [Komagataella phaffii GS115]AOA60486.1 GQ67_01516T0 [Komagataella phaffii]CAH2447308.1 Hypothetical protein BQ9382_C1-7485 [Komagataella phaffii CBS 7435]AOA66781.1 GQ68_01532T0 [Komagataella phaffii GS115]CAY68482.1 Hypothetical protein PAS_chr1-4_0622 [Komagataella phaffii GS115]CCA37547.1 Hypothetical protein PP7435_CHR1-1433 [Komagataella phaffii CBS 7435]
MVKLCHKKSHLETLPHVLSFGVPWRLGELHENDLDRLQIASASSPRALSSKPLAYWPDGSIKWSAHSTLDDGTLSGDLSLGLKETTHQDTTAVFSIPETKNVAIETPNLRVEFGNAGDDCVIKNLNDTVYNGRSHLQVIDESANTQISVDSKVLSVEIESRSHVQIVVLVTGAHVIANKVPTQVPYQLRFYIGLHSDVIAAQHTFLYQLPEGLRLKSLGISFDIDLGTSQPFNKYVRLGGSEGGVLAEASQNLTGLWKPVPKAISKGQVLGERLPDIADWDYEWKDLLKYVVRWNDFKLSQLSPYGFELKKRVSEKNSWVKISSGTKSDGTAFVGSSKRGLGIGLKNFWEQYPVGLEVANLDLNLATLTLWLYSPDSEPMDLRPYQNLDLPTYEEQLDAMKITYEDWEPGFCDPYGIAKTHEFQLWTPKSTPSKKEFQKFSNTVRATNLIVPEAQHIFKTRVFADYWAPGPHIAPGADASGVDSNLEFLFDYYEAQIKENSWYGFWDFGDVMHTYDADRHCWRYDVGGYAWDNSELSTDLWLWLYFLRTQDIRVWDVAKAMTRHTGEVDVYHSGKWKGLGTRHGVQHFGDSCKQLRISNALYRRFFFYLSGGDERTGELMQELIDSQNSLTVLDSHRKVRKAPDVLPPRHVLVNIGTDFTALASAWFTNYERRSSGWQRSEKLIKGFLKTFEVLDYGFATGTVLMNLDNGQITKPSLPLAPYAISHLSSVFGLTEILSELFINFQNDDLIEAVKREWIRYSLAYNGGEEKQLELYGFSFGDKILRQGHARLISHSSVLTNDESLQKEAWNQFFTLTDETEYKGKQWTTEKLDTSETVNKQSAACGWITTNITAQYGIAALALLGRDAYWAGQN